MYTQLSVHTVSLDEFASNATIAKNDLLKVDTEGHELEVLIGAHFLLEHKRIGMIQIERQETGLRSPEEHARSTTGVETLLNSLSYFKVKTVSHLFAKFYDDFFIWRPQ